MSAVASGVVKVESPFPGLLAFNPGQSKYFYGRNKQVEEILRHLEKHRFLAVIGSSGCGKSSLVRAGLLPALYRGYLSSGPNWSIALMKPGSRPIEALSDALHDKDCFGPAAQFNSAELLDTTRGLVAVAQDHILPAQSLLIVVDQFEEIFRFSKESEAADAEASHFVELLLHAASRTELRIHVVLTMRTDYFTDCAQFDGLPEEMNQGQFLVPRLTREQRQEAIEGPLTFVGVPFTTRLVQQVLNDFGDDPNNLPVLQHALRRTFEQWQADVSAQSIDTEHPTGPLDIPHYENATRNGGAIEQHCEEVYGRLSSADRTLAEKIFRCLTTMDRGRRVRRPRHVDLIRRVAGNASGVDYVIDQFIREGFLIKGRDGTVDLTHERLIGGWARFSAWVDQERIAAKWYQHLAEAAKDQLSPWRGRELNEALAHQRSDGWNEAWALQYGPGYDEAMRFLKRSNLLRKLRVLAGITLVAMIIAGATLFVYRLNQEKRRAEGEAHRAEQQAKRAEIAELAAKSARDEAKSEARRAQAAIANSEEEKGRLLKEAETYRATSTSFKRQAAVAAGGPVPPIPMPEAKATPNRPRAADPGETNSARNRPLQPTPAPDNSSQRFVLGAYSLQPIKGLEGRAAVFIGELPTLENPSSIYVVLSRDTSVSVAALREPTRNKSIVKDLINVADGRPNPGYPSLMFANFAVSRDSNLGNGLELGGFTIKSIGARYIVILKEFAQHGGMSLELKLDRP
jgi:energy-coupling factor transporter ATP-binding protein EcfA2